MMYAKTRSVTLAIAAWLLACPPALAQAGGAAFPDCGGDAFSSAEVVENRPPRRGPLTAVPDTLCADLAPQQPPTRVDIYANPIILRENGRGGGRAPYDGQLLLNSGPPRPLRP